MRWQRPWKGYNHFLEGDVFAGQVLFFPFIKQHNILLSWYFTHDPPLLQETCMGHSMTGWMHKAACGLSHPTALSDLG